MNLKKIMYICLILIIAVSCLSAVSSAYLESKGITPFSQDTTVTVDGLSFNIPAGYGEDTSDQKNDVEKDGIITNDRTYFNENADLVGITIIYPKDGSGVKLETFREPKSVEKTIDGKTGYLDKSEDVEDLYFFTYIENGKAVMLSAPNEDTFSQIII